MIDGGVRSGADVVKLLALGAKAVGLGRTFLYANGTHGEEGVRRVIESELLFLYYLQGCQHLTLCVANVFIQFSAKKSSILCGTLVLLQSAI